MHFTKILDRSKLPKLNSDLKNCMILWSKETDFPTEALPKHFVQTLIRAFAFTTPTRLNCPDELVDSWLENKDKKFKFSDLGTILYVLKDRTRNELEMTLQQYKDYRAMCNDLFKVYYEVSVAQEKFFADELETRALAEMEEAVDGQAGERLFAARAMAEA